MTAKHFASIAASLKAARPNVPTSAELALWVQCCNEIASTCDAANPRFDRARFLAACGV
jgi:hypothetical protein